MAQAILTCYYAIPDNSGDYEQTVNTLTLGMTWQMLEALSCRLEGHYSESEASFSPDFNVEGPYPYNIYSDPVYLRDTEQVPI